MPSKGNYYGQFDYGSAYGSNPFADPARRISEWIDKWADQSSRQKTASGGSSSSTWAGNVVKPEDADVQEYMANIMGGQRRALNDYTAQAAGAGIKRGGLNVVGGPALDSSLHLAAMKNLAAGYADRLRQGMDYGKYVRGAQYKQYQDERQDLQSMMNLQHRYLSSQSDWQNRLGDTMHGDWRSDVDWDRQTPLRDLQLEQAKNRADMERWKNTVERESYQRSREEALDRETKWNQMARKYGNAYSVGKFGAGWTWEDDLKAERLGVEMGYLKPWNRSLTMKGGGLGK